MVFPKGEIMQKTRINEEVIKMRFDDVYGRYKGKQIRTDEAAELLGISVRTFYRKRERFEGEGFNGRFDYRLGKPAVNRAEDSEVQKMTRLYEERYRGFNVKHFHEYAQREHGLKYGYTWTKNTLEKSGFIRKSKRGGDHRLRRERRVMEGMMLHQDGSTHRWIPALDYHLDLIITMDDATSKITSCFLIEEEEVLNL